MDDDNDGLIEIHNLDMLRDIHYDLAGTSHGNDNRGAPTASTTNCTINVGTDQNPIYLCGYELKRDLDFADDNSYATTTGGNISANFTNKTWQPVDSNSTVVAAASGTNPGFPGIGADTGATGGFDAIFDGNGYAIKNLYMRNTESDEKYAGLFRFIEESAVIRNLGLENAHVYGGNAADQYVGALVGLNRGASKIISSYVKGGTVNGDANTDNVGGLVGRLNGASLIACYATNAVNGGDGTDSVGGLVGYANAGSITATYSTGAVDGGAGNDDQVGGLVGKIAIHQGDPLSIIASYATGDVKGGAGTNDKANHLVGSYAGTASSSNVTITDSYGFGLLDSSVEDKSDGSSGTPKPGGATGASDLSPTNAGDSWNEVRAWGFGNGDDPRHAPKLKYAEYDGDSGTNYCDSESPDRVFSSGCDTKLPGQDILRTYLYVCSGGDKASGDIEEENETNRENCERCYNGYQKEQIGTTGRNKCLKKYTCDKGTPVDAIAPDQSNPENCQSCSDTTRYGLKQIGTTGRNECLKKYTCENGTPVDDIAPDQNNTVNCDSCNTGYRRVGSVGSRTCAANAYSCPNGNPATGRPDTHNAVSCTGCNSLYHLEGSPGSQTCEANTYSCPNGVAVTIDSPTTHEAVNCDSCNTGYRRVGFVGSQTCEANAYTCPNGTPAAGRPATHEAVAIVVILATVL